MISVIVGGIGNSKTLYMTYLTALKKLSNYNVLSNYWLDFENIPIKNYEDIKDFLKIQKREGLKGKIQLALDEGWIYFDARMAMSWSNINWSRFVLQTRKVGFDLDITAQDLSQIDVRIRNVIDNIFIPKVLIWEGIPKESKPILIEVSQMKKDVMGFYKQMPKQIIPITDSLLELYDTYEIIV